MPDNIRPRRSVLYMPGANTRALDKARRLPVDGLIMDLEDAVAPTAKAQARANVLGAIREGGYGRREIIVRVNGLDTPWGRDDVAAAACSGADAVLLPKISSTEALTAAIAALNAAGAPESLDVWVMAETAAGILGIGAIAAASPRLSVIVLGTSDLAQELRIEPGPGRIGLLAALSGCVLAARARGLDILDGVHVDLTDARGLRNACEQGRSLGFDGKTLIHPGQIEVANQIFGVAEEQLARANAIVAAWDQAAARGEGIAVVDGRMVEKLHADDARRVLALDAAIRRQEQELIE